MNICVDLLHNNHLHFHQTKELYNCNSNVSVLNVSYQRKQFRHLILVWGINISVINICVDLHNNHLHFYYTEEHQNSVPLGLVSEDDSTPVCVAVPVLSLYLKVMIVPQLKIVPLFCTVSSTLWEILTPILHKSGYNLAWKRTSFSCISSTLFPTWPFLNHIKNRQIILLLPSFTEVKIYTLF